MKPQRPTRRVRSRRTFAAVVSVGLSLSVAACAARPGPPPVVDPGAHAAPPPPQVQHVNQQRSITIGIDSLRNGFNPHLIADDDAFTQALARLVLPSAFVDGVLNKDLLNGATEVPAAAGAAMTVRYIINPAAQWSDGTPITGTDFAYLAQQLANQPGVEDSAGYRAISNIRTSNGGKTVDVDFDTPIKDWTPLFSNILPSHLVRVLDVPFDQVLGDTIPASGNLYMVKGVDRARGLVTLARNDRYWGPNPAKIELLTFKTIRSTAEGSEMLRSGQLAAADLTPDQTSKESYSLVPGTQVIDYQHPARLDLDFSVTSPLLSSVDLRRAVASLIDIPTVARLASGRTSDLTPAQPWPGLPTPPPQTEQDQTPTEQAGENPTAPNADPAAQSVENLKNATTNRQLVVAADASDDVAVAAALTIADVLQAAGVQAQPLLTSPAAISAGVSTGTIDAVVSWHRAGTNPVILASQFQCDHFTVDDARAHADGAGGRPVVLDTPAGAQPSQTPTGSADPAVTLLPEGDVETPTTTRRTLGGWCDPDTDAFVSQMLAGTVDIAQGRQHLAELSGKQALSVPLLEQQRLFLVGSTILGPAPELTQWPLLLPAGPLASAGSWTKTQDTPNRNTAPTPDEKQPKP
ncbi:ABC transporter family substrate-binding protein [Corynebacterium aquilae]|uniref:ABC transporter family substrate-binding protein n=1 Tax=Corynebacterium aquilae TaxID=203263 RepID=UPI00095127A3|nr:ABC transporter family substrate-binding protein [Corynebacterium aquilae]